jgi:hypothetical protein
MQTMTEFMSWKQWRTAMVLSFLLVPATLSIGQDAGRDTRPDRNGHPSFTEADAVRLLEQLRRGLESDNPGIFLKTFDAKRMPGYPAFRDRVDEFFGRYDEFQARYHVTQVTMDGELGAALADFEFDATPRDGVSPNLRKRVPLRLVCGWDGKQWKVVDLSPRNWLE